MGESNIEVICHVCGHVGAMNGEDGYFYCERCWSRAEDIVETMLDDKRIYTGNALRRRIKADRPPVSHSGNLLNNHGSNRLVIGDGPDKEEDYLRMTYVTGLQTMIQLQTRVLVDKFNVSPLICGIAGTIWLRYVVSTGVFNDQWANEVIKDSESHTKGLRENFKPKFKHRAESFNIHGQRAVMLWYRSLSKTIPLSHTLVITFLACHIAREALLPTDILKWSLEGKLPFYTAYKNIEKLFGDTSVLCPLSCSFMFRPSESISLNKLETKAASIAQKIGLKLPPVNFYAIASRYLKQLSLDSGKILPSVCQIYEFSNPPDLWLSANEMGLPTRVCVMSMVIIAIRFLYNIHGFGYWERSYALDLSTGKSLEGSTSTADISGADSSRDVDKSDLEAMDLLRQMEERYDELEETYEYSKDLPTYLQYCKDVAFSAAESSYDDHDVEKLVEELWNYYLNEKDSLLPNNHDANSISPSKRSKNHEVLKCAKKCKAARDLFSCTDDYSQKNMRVDDDTPQQSTSLDDCQKRENVYGKDKAMKRLRLNMSLNRFCYIPQRVKVKRRDYLQYVRKIDDGAYTYAAHADYYILIRSCARVAKVDVRFMHCAVMILERRLGWLEKRIDYCLSRLGFEEEFCEHCRQEMENGV